MPFLFGQPLIRFDIVQLYMSYEWPDDFDVHAVPAVVVRCGIWMGSDTNLNNSRNGFLFLGMIEEPTVAHGHLRHEIAGLVVADTVSFFTNVPFGDLVVPTPNGRFGFKKPVPH